MAGLTAWWVRPVTQAEFSRLAVNLPEGERLYEDASPSFAMSADGRRVVFVGRAINETVPKLFVRDLTSFDTRLLVGSEGGNQPVFSPDGESLAYTTSRSLILRISTNGGKATQLCEATAPPRGLAWTERGEILFGTAASGIWRVSENGGTPGPVTALAPGETGHSDPTLLPDDRGVLFTVGRPGSAEIAVLPSRAKEHRVLFEGHGAAYASSGHILFGRAGSAALFAAPFDLDSLEVQGPPFQLEETLTGNANGQPQFRLGADGTLVYSPGENAGSQVVWVDRGGRIEVAGASDRRYHTVHLSPDGKSFAADEAGGNNRIWVHDLDRGARVLAVSGNNLQTPRFKPDGAVMAYGNPEGIFVRAVDGTGEAHLLVDKERHVGDPAWSPDGRLLAFSYDHPDTKEDLWILSPDGLPQPFLVTSAAERAPAFAPDGKWIAYPSDASGGPEIYIQAYPGPGTRYLISTNGGKEPVWSRDGRELFYRENTAVMAVSVEAGDSFRAGAPKLLFDGPYPADTGGHASYDVSADGQKFLMIRNEEAAVTELRIFLNFTEDLKTLASHR